MRNNWNNQAFFKLGLQVRASAGSEKADSKPNCWPYEEVKK